jgi:hypothetical protein
MMGSQSTINGFTSPNLINAFPSGGAAGLSSSNSQNALQGTTTGVNQNGQAMTTNLGLQNSQTTAARNNMTFYNGEWWYRGPNNSLMYYRNNTWVPYQPGEYTPFTAGYRGVGNNAANGVTANGRVFTTRRPFRSPTTSRSTPTAP